MAPTGGGSASGGRGGPNNPPPGRGRHFRGGYGTGRGGARGGRSPRESHTGDRTSEPSTASGKAGKSVHERLGDGKWQVARGKGKAKAASSRDSPAGDKGGDRSGPHPSTAGVSNDVWRLWRKQGRCLMCGSESHRVAECSLNARTPTSTATARTPQTAGARAKGPPYGSKSSDANRPKGILASRGNQRTGEPMSKFPQTAVDKRSTGSDVDSRKRGRDSVPTGETPPAKRTTNTKRHTYAQAASGALEMAIVNKDRVHCSWKGFSQLRLFAEERFLQQLERGVVPLAVDKWDYNTHWATVHASDDASLAELRNVASKLNLQLVPKAEMEAIRKPTVVYCGLIQGPTAKHSKEVLERLLKFEKERNKIPGRLDYISVTPVARSENVLMRIVVDTDAEARMKELDGCLRLGASGLVKFEDVRAKFKVDNSTRLKKIEALETSIESAKAQLHDMVKAKAELEQQMDIREALPSVPKPSSSSTTHKDSGKPEKPVADKPDDYVDEEDETDKNLYN